VSKNFDLPVPFNWGYAVAQLVEALRYKPEGRVICHPSPAPHFKTFQVFLMYFPKYPSFSTIQSYVPNAALH
jgi:hypothetical protein